MFGVAQFYLGSYLTVAAIFIWAIRNPEVGWSPIVFIGRHLSLLVYVLHIAVRDFLAILLRGLLIDQLPSIRWMLPGIVVALSPHVAFVLNWVWKRAETTKYTKYAPLCRWN